MKSILLFSFLTLLANTFWCGRKEPDIEPIPPAGGLYNITERQTWLFDGRKQIIGETKETFNKGERTFELNRENGNYNEFENGVLTKSGTFTDNGGALLVILTGDTLINEIVGIGESSLRLNRVELIPNGKRQIMIQSEK